jgi:hypothetical protein
MVTPKQVRAQLARSRSFLERARNASDHQEWHDSLLAGVYFAQSAIEFMRETAKEAGLTVELRRFDEIVAQIAPRARFLRALRVRDFHRAPVLGLGYAQLEHSIRLPPLGQATIGFNPNPTAPSVQVRVSDGSTNYKFFFVGHGFVQDHLEPIAIRLDALLAEQLLSLDLCVKRFTELLRKPDAA